MASCYRISSFYVTLAPTSRSSIREIPRRRTPEASSTILFFSDHEPFNLKITAQPYLNDAWEALLVFEVKIWIDGARRGQIVWTTADGANKRSISVETLAQICPDGEYTEEAKPLLFGKRFVRIQIRQAWKRAAADSVFDWAGEYGTPYNWVFDREDLLRSHTLQEIARGDLKPKARVEVPSERLVPWSVLHPSRTRARHSRKRRRDEGEEGDSFEAAVEDGRAASRRRLEIAERRESSRGNTKRRRIQEREASQRLAAPDSQERSAQEQKVSEATSEREATASGDEEVDHWADVVTLRAMGADRSRAKRPGLLRLLSPSPSPPPQGRDTLAELAPSRRQEKRRRGDEQDGEPRTRKRRG